MVDRRSNSTRRRLEGEEVSCRTLGFFFEELERLGVKPDTLSRGTGYSIEYLKDPRQRIGWDAFRRFGTNTRRVWTESQLIELGTRLARFPRLRSIALVTRLLYSPADVYRAVADLRVGGGHTEFACLDNFLEHVGPNRLRLRIELDEGYAPCREFFLITQGTLIALPEVAGHGPSEVALHETPRGAVYEIRVASGGGTLRWLRKVLTWPFALRTTARALGEANKLLFLRQHELETEIIERRRIEHELGNHARDMAVLSQVMMCSAEADGLENLLGRAVDSLVDLLDLETGEAFVVDYAKGQAVRIYRRSIPEATAHEPLDLDLDQSPYDFVFANALPVISDQYPEILPPPSGDATPYESALIVPLVAGRRIPGALRLASRRHPSFAYDTLKVLQVVGRQLGAAVARLRAEGERLRLMRELASKNTELESFTHTVSHDLKNPLVTIKGFLGLLEQNIAQGKMDGARRQTLTIARAADTMERLLEGLRALSMVGLVCNPTAEVDLGAVAHEAVHLLQGPLTEKGLGVEIAPDLPRVRGDRIRLLEVFLKLLDNAIKFHRSVSDPAPPTEPDGVPEPPPPVLPLEITGERQGGEVVCRLRDHGLGIDPRYLERVFNLFEQLDPSVSGTGIGLTLARRILDHHGGRIWAESAGPDQGTTFFFTLPLLDLVPHDEAQSSHPDLEDTDDRAAP